MASKGELRKLIMIALATGAMLAIAANFNGALAKDGSGGGGGGGGDRPLASLKTVAIPNTDFSPYLNSGSQAKAAAIALGKALFWDTQTGGDGRQACATCHFNAGVDSRAKDQLNPGVNGAREVPSSGLGANYTPTATDYPFHQLANVDDRNSQVLFDSDDVSGSEGLYHTQFISVVPGSASDAGTSMAPTSGYNIAGVDVRRTTGKNAPSVINAVFNYRSFWDGRAQNVFNGVNPAGSNDPSAFVLKAAANGSLQKVTVSIANGSLASQSVGPPNNPVEMSYDGRIFPMLGKKLLSLKPLAVQTVAADDSVLGTYSAGTGLNTSYAALIQTAFQPQWWKSKQQVDASGNPVKGSASASNFTVMEYNFSLFWGIAIQLYESTLLANDSRFDRFMAGDNTALTPLEQNGLNVFQGKGNCTKCHMGPELTDASVGNQPFAKVGGAGNPVKGFHFIGVRPATDEPIVASGAAKTPGLRNVELTAPYFHNGGALTLEQVVDFYSRGGNFGVRGVDLDNEINVFGFGSDDKAALVAFLKSLTDERVRNQSAPFDHPSINVPHGAIGDNNALTLDATGKAQDEFLMVPATGRNGSSPLPTFAQQLH